MSARESIASTQNNLHRWNYPILKKVTVKPETFDNHHHYKKYFYKSTLLFVLRKHARKHTESVFDCRNKLNPYECSRCEKYRTWFLKCLKQHLREKHSNEMKKPQPTIKATAKHKMRTFKCNRCPYEAKEKRDVTNHTIRRHTKTSEIEWIQCEHCPSKFKLKSDLQNHMIKHDEQRHWWKCELCSYGTPYISNLHAHVKRKHVAEIKWIQCELCPYKSISIHMMRRHKLALHESTDNIKWFYCTECPYKGKTRDYLKKHHQRYHLKIYKHYDCEQCSYRGFSNATLRDHVTRVHMDASEIQWLQCDHCPAKFKVKDTLRRHMIKCEGVA